MTHAHTCKYMDMTHTYMHIYLYMNITHTHTHTHTLKYIYIYIYIRGAYNMFPDFFRMGTPTTPMTQRYWQIHPTKPKHYCIVANEPPQIGPHVNALKTEYMCYNQTDDISTQDRTSLKLVDKITYQGSNVSSNEKDIDTQLTKAWTANDRLSILWKSDLNDKMKRSFFQAAVVSILLYGCTTWALTKRLEKKLDGNFTRMLRAILYKSWRKPPQWPPASHHENYKS